jgi:hypothetical protein
LIITFILQHTLQKKVVFITQNHNSWHLFVVNFVVSSITMYNIMWHLSNDTLQLNTLINFIILDDHLWLSV